MVHVAGPLETYLDHFYLLSRDGVRAVLMPQGGTPVTVVPLLPAGAVTVRMLSGTSGVLLTLATALPEDLVGGVAGSHDYDIQSLPTGWVETDEVVSVSSSTLTTVVNPPPPLRQTRKVISVSSPAGITEATRIDVEVSDRYNTGSETWAIHFEVAPAVGNLEDLYYAKGGEAAVTLLSLDVDDAGAGSPTVILAGYDDYELVADTTLVLNNLPTTTVRLMLTLQAYDADAAAGERLTASYPFEVQVYSSVSFSGRWHTRLLLDDGVRSIARLSGSGFPASVTVNVSVSHPDFFYAPADDGDGGLLRAAPPPSGGQYTVSVVVSTFSEIEGFSPENVEAVYTLEWIGENAIYLIGGNRDNYPSGGTGFRRDVQRFDGRRWRSSGNLATSGREHAAALHKGRGWVLGGNFDGRVYQSSNFWSRWPALYTDDTAWRNMTGSEMVSHGGTLWIIAGKPNAGAAGSTKNVWRLDESTNRFTLAATAQFSRRQLHEAVSYAGSLWVLGGAANSNSNNSAIANVWASADGISWRRVGNLPSRRFEHQVAVHAGSMYLYGGRESGGTNSGAVWASADGANWRLVAGAHPAGRRKGHQMVSSGGNLWVIGGYEDTGNIRLKDIHVWYSPDGARWTRGVQMPDGRGRDQHQVIVRPRPLPDGAPEPVGLSAEGAASSYHVTVGTTTPVDLFTLSIGGGLGGASINVDIVDDANVVGWKTVAERVIQVTAVGSDGDVATVTLVVSDGTPDSIEVVFTISFVASTGFVPDEGGNEGDGQQWFVAMADFIPAGERARVGGVFRYSNGEGDGGFLFRYGRMPFMNRVARASG